MESINRHNLMPGLASGTADLQKILALQQENLLHTISDEERVSEGFLTMKHDLPTLEKMNALGQAVIITDGEQLAGYALTMVPECRHLMPALEPMFKVISDLSLDGRPLTSYRQYIMGQICVGKSYRGNGLFDMLYAHHREVYGSRYDLIITEIATRNHRSLKAHKRVGFETIHIHRDELDEWAVVVWRY